MEKNVKTSKPKTKELKKIISKASKGLLTKIEDFVLMQFALLEELSPQHATEMSSSRVLERFNLRMAGINPNEYYKSFSYAFERARKNNWIKKSKALTKEGRERLEEILPSYRKSKIWDGNWYLVIFDIPERKGIKGTRLRDIFRERIKRLGFGKLQRSVWVSAYNFLPNVQDLIKKYYLFQQVMLSQTDKLGQEDSCSLAERVWNLNKINEAYQEFIRYYQNKNKKDILRFKVKVDYLSILERDAQLPRELLSRGWAGEEAYRLYQQLVS